MAHVFVAIEARELWMDTFLNDLLKRRYPHKLLNGRIGWTQPNPREIRMFDITVPEACIPTLMSDLAPFMQSNPGLRSPKKDFASVVVKVLRIGSGLNSFYPEKKTWLVKIPKIGKWLDRGVRIILKEKPPAKEYEHSGETRHQWVNVLPIGWTTDEKDPNSKMGYLPKVEGGGELV